MACCNRCQSIYTDPIHYISFSLLQSTFFFNFFIILFCLLTIITLAQAAKAMKLQSTSSLIDAFQCHLFAYKIYRFLNWFLSISCNTAHTAIRSIPHLLLNTFFVTRVTGRCHQRSKNRVGVPDFSQVFSGIRVAHFSF